MGVQEEKFVKFRSIMQDDEPKINTNMYVISYFALAKLLPEQNTYFCIDKALSHIQGDALVGCFS